MSKYLQGQKFAIHASILFVLLGYAPFAVAANLPTETLTQASTKSSLAPALVQQMQLPAKQDQVDPIAQATATANQFQTMSNTIKSQQQEIGKLTTKQSSISIAIQLKAIITAIELECKKLADLVNADPSATSSTDSTKLNSIVDKLEAQRQSLISLIMMQQAEPPINSHPENPSDITPTTPKFTVYQTDK